MAILGFWRTTLDNFYDWQGENGNPAEGTVNQILGYSTNNINGVTRYTEPIVHKNSTCDRDFLGMPIRGSIIGVETDVICTIDENCPPSKIPPELLTQEEFDSLNWVDRFF